MGIDMWLVEEVERLRRFKKMWQQESAKDPENWPADMNPGEWDEQYRAFESGAE